MSRIRNLCEGEAEIAALPSCLVSGFPVAEAADVCVAVLFAKKVRHSEALPCGAVSFHPVEAVEFLLVKLELEIMERLRLMEVLPGSEPSFGNGHWWSRLRLAQGFFSLVL